MRQIQPQPALNRGHKTSTSGATNRSTRPQFGIEQLMAAEASALRQ
jgi:hypothetical protein